MIDLKLSPPREGNRGGREQFKWEDLKGHDLKDREYYLGHSVKVGLLKRKNTFYKHDWYLQSDSATSKPQEDEELELTKKYEDEVMQEMLGMKPKRLMLLKSKPTSVQQLRAILEIPEATTSKEDDSDGDHGQTTSHTARESNHRNYSPERRRSESRGKGDHDHKDRKRSRIHDKRDDRHRSRDRGYKARDRSSSGHRGYERDTDVEYRREHSRRHVSRRSRSPHRRSRYRSKSADENSTSRYGRFSREANSYRRDKKHKHTHRRSYS